MVPHPLLQTWLYELTHYSFELVELADVERFEMQWNTDEQFPITKSSTVRTISICNKWD